MPGQTYGRAVDVSANWYDKGVTAGVRGLNTELDKTGTSARGAASGAELMKKQFISTETIMEDFTRSLRNMFVGYVSIRGVMEIGKLGVEMYETRNQAHILAQALQFELAFAGKSVAQAMRETREQTAGVIEDMTIMTQMRAAMQGLRNVGFSPEEAYNYFQTSSRFAVMQSKVFNRGDPNEILNRIMVGTMRGSANWFDEYNINLFGTTGTANIAAGALAQMNQQLSEQGRLVEGSITSLARWRTAWENFKAGTSGAAAGGISQDTLLGRIISQQFGLNETAFRGQLWAGLPEEERRMRLESGYGTGLTGEGIMNGPFLTPEQQRMMRQRSQFDLSLQISQDATRRVALLGQSGGLSDLRAKQDLADRIALQEEINRYRTGDFTAYQGRVGIGAGKVPKVLWDEARLGSMWDEPPSAAWPDTRRRGRERFMGSWGSEDRDYRGQKVHYMGMGESFGAGFNQWVPQGGMSQMFGQQLGQQAFGTFVGGPMMMLTNAIMSPFERIMDNMMKEFGQAVGLFSSSTETFEEQVAKMQAAYGARAGVAGFLGNDAEAMKWTGLSALFTYSGTIGRNDWLGTRGVEQMFRSGDISGALDLIRQLVMSGAIPEDMYNEDLSQFMSVMSYLSSATEENTAAIERQTQILAMNVADAALRASYSGRFLGATSDEEVYQLVQDLMGDRSYLLDAGSGSYGGGGSGSSGVDWSQVPGSPTYTGGLAVRPSRVDLHIVVEGPDGSTIAREIKAAEQRGSLRLTIGADGKKVDVRAM